MTERTAAGRDSEAERLFVDWLARQAERSGARDGPAQPTSGRRETDADALAALCTEHPEHSATLRALHADYRHAASVLERFGQSLPAASAGGAGSGPALADRIRAQYGPGVDPGIALEPAGADATASDFSSDVLSRLSSRPDGSERYRIQGELDRGGQGAILRVWDEDLRRHLAMKVMLGKVSPSDTAPTAPAAGSAPQPPTPVVDARTVGRFLEEAQITGQLDHPGIVPVHELGLDSQGRVFFTMKLVKGEDLKAVFARVHAGEAGWTPTHALSLLLRVCEAMSYAHSKRVIHRDLKPSNIMVGRFGEVFVMDWGLSRVLDREDDKDVRVRPQPALLTSAVHSERRERAASDPDSPLVTMDGDVVGTPAYMSPEQASGKLDRMGPPSDVYALGAMLYHLLTGRMPFVTPGAPVNNYAILSRVQEGPPAGVASLAPAAPAELVAICEKAMAREPASRYADMSALAGDLRAYLEHRVVAAYETGAVAELRKWVVRNKPLAAALAAVLVLLLASVSIIAVFNADLQDALTQKSSLTADLSAKNESLQSALARESSQRDLQDLVARADSLWPAQPEQVEAYETWLADARELLDGCAADHEPGSLARPSLTQHKVELAELRARAVAPTDAKRLAALRFHPRSAELQAKRAQWTWFSRMLGLEPWPSEAEAELAPELRSSDARSLNWHAFQVVDPRHPVYGDEVKALLLARRAVAAAADAERYFIHDTLAWALFRRGRPDEALAEEQRALEAAPPDRHQEYEGRVAKLQQAVAAWRGDALAQRSTEREALGAEIESLALLVGERTFVDPEDSLWNVQLSQLVSELEALQAPTTGLMGDNVAEPHGWGVQKRYKFAQTIRERSVTGPEAQARWTEAIAAIAASPKYGGLVLTRQLGLLPIGADRDAGLWEFWHVQSGDEPLRGADGKLVPTESMGMVLVLIPGGTFWMGAQNTDPAGRNYDPLAQSDEGPVHEVTLSSYFLSKYELTQGQWERFTGRNPSGNPVGTTVGQHMTTLIHPVEQVRWEEAMQELRRLGLELPTEAQWERGARAGTDTPWSTGRDRETLIGAANLADQAAARGARTWSDIRDWPDLDDGWALHAPVGSFRPNAFGLHEMHGNVWEWCRDSYDGAFYSRSPSVDPVNDVPGDLRHSYRSGSFSFAASLARSAYRSIFHPPEFRTGPFGLRPAKGITP